MDSAWRGLSGGTPHACSARGWPSSGCIPGGTRPAHQHAVNSKLGAPCHLAAAGPEQQLLADARRQWARMERLPEDARRRRLVAWLQVRGRGGGLRSRAACCTCPRLPSWLLGRVVGRKPGELLLPVLSANPPPPAQATSFKAPRPQNHALHHLQLAGANCFPAACAQRRGHRWDDIRGLLHQLEKEDARHAIDGAGGDT